jgi:hypothetical protein
VRRTDREERVAVRRGAHDRLGGDIGCSTWSVLNDEWLGEPLGEPLTDQACDNVDHPAGP